VRAKKLPSPHSEGVRVRAPEKAEKSLTHPSSE